MKILIITNSLKPDSGYGRYTEQLVKALKAEKNISVETLALDSPLKYLYNPIRIFSLSRKIKNEIKRILPDVVHFICEPYINSLFFLPQEKKIKYIATFHGTYSTYFMTLGGIKKWISKFLYKKAIKKIDKIICVSNYTRNRLHKLTKISRNKTIVINNGVEIEKFTCRERKVSREKKQIIFVGAVKPRKGLHHSLKVIYEFKKISKTPFVYKIFGSYNENDQYYKSLIKTLKDLNLEKEVFFMGQASDPVLQEEYCKSDLFLMISENTGIHFEGFGLVYLEANAAGVPTIGPHGSGVEDAIADGHSGYLVDLEKAKEIAQKISLILDKSAIKAKDCIGWARKHDINLISEKYLIIY